MGYSLERALVGLFIIASSVVWGVCRPAAGGPAIGFETHGDRTPTTVVGAQVDPTPTGEADLIDLGEPVTDFSDRRRLIRFVENVFVGRAGKFRGWWVAGTTDTVWKTDGPITLGGRKVYGHNTPLYEVRVLERIKGTLPGNIILAGRVKPGREYVFATNAAPNGEWQMVISPHGAVPVDGNRAQLVHAFRRAYEDQIVYVRPTRPPE
jgi:hypothetical protein